jgi:hypothetical protein
MFIVKIVVLSCRKVHKKTLKEVVEEVEKRLGVVAVLKRPEDSEEGATGEISKREDVKQAQSAAAEDDDTRKEQHQEAKASADADHPAETQVISSFLLTSHLLTCSVT